MDIPRQVKPSRRKYYLGAGLTVATGLLFWGLSSLKPAAPAVERQSVLIDTVKRGAMVFQVARGRPATRGPHVRRPTSCKDA